MLAAVAGATAFVGGYQMLSTGRLSDLYFNLEFSSIVYKVGEFHKYGRFRAFSCSRGCWCLLERGFL